MAATKRTSTRTRSAPADALGARAPGGRAAAWPASRAASRQSRRGRACRRRRGSKQPLREAWAPVNAPFSWPNSSLSSSASGMAAQLTGTNGPAARALPRWMRRANTLLAGAGVAGDEHRRVAHGDGPALPLDLLQWRARRVDQLGVEAALRSGARGGQGHERLRVARAAAATVWMERALSKAVANHSCGPGLTRAYGVCRAEKPRPQMARLSSEARAGFAAGVVHGKGRRGRRADATGVTTVKAMA